MLSSSVENTAAGYVTSGEMWIPSKPNNISSFKQKDLYKVGRWVAVCKMLIFDTSVSFCSNSEFGQKQACASRKILSSNSLTCRGLSVMGNSELFLYYAFRRKLQFYPYYKWG